MHRNKKITMTTENTYFLVCGFALVFFLGFVIGTIVAGRANEKEEAKAEEDRQSWKVPVPQRKIKEVKLTVADSVAAPPPPDPNEDPVAKADRERIESIQREEAARR